MTAVHERGWGGWVGPCVFAASLLLVPMRGRADEAADATLTGAYHLASSIHQTLTGDWQGLRDRLDERGIDIGVEYIGETFGDVSGGIDQGTIYEGRLELGLDLNLQKLVDWRGAK